MLQGDSEKARRVHTGFAEGTASMDDRRGMGPCYSSDSGMDAAVAQGMEADQRGSWKGEV